MSRLQGEFFLFILSILAMSKNLILSVQLNLYVNFKWNDYILSILLSLLNVNVYIIIIINFEMKCLYYHYYHFWNIMSILMILSILFKLSILSILIFFYQFWNRMSISSTLSKLSILSILKRNVYIINII